jgi:RHS repeat-associated protein
MGEGPACLPLFVREASASPCTTTSDVYDVNAGLPVVLDDGSRKYVWGLSLAYAVDTAGNIEVYHTDGLGSVRAITDGSGNVVQTYRRDEFGVPIETQGMSSQPFGYTGEQTDAESGFVYLRARYYDPTIGRFITRDPLAGSRSNPLSQHRYVYVQNNPCNRVDPSGL